MRALFVTTFVILLALSSSAVKATGVAERDAIAAVLDDFHKAASESNAERYFSHFSEDAVFLGTDAKERWTVEQFRQFATPFFEKGHGWTYLPTRRYITVHKQRSVAWFDELLDSVKFGQIRGSGVLVLTPKGWKISLYDLHFPIPNDLTAELTSRIKAYLTEKEIIAPATDIKKKTQEDAEIEAQKVDELVDEIVDELNESVGDEYFESLPDD